MSSSIRQSFIDALSKTIKEKDVLDAVLEAFDSCVNGDSIQALVKESCSCSYEYEQQVEEIMILRAENRELRRHAKIP